MTRVADQMLRSSQRVGDAWRGVQDALAVPAAAFGDDAVGSWVHAGHQAVVEGADGAFDQLVAVLEGDMDRMYRVAFAYAEADENAADRFPITPV